MDYRKVYLITGDREWDSAEVMIDELERYDRNSLIIHGNARGADKMAAVICEELGWKKEDIISVPAEWIKYKKAAGPIRNRKMHDTYNPIKVIAFHNNINNSKGTKDMLNYALKKGTENILRTYDITKRFIYTANGIVTTAV